MVVKAKKKQGDAHDSIGSEPVFEEIAARAYEIHLSGAGGDDVENWLRAERELTAEHE